MNGVGVGRGVGKGVRAKGVGVNGMATGEGAGWGVAVGAGVAVGRDASAVATLSSAILRTSSSERTQAVKASNTPSASPAMNPFITAAPGGLLPREGLERKQFGKSW